MVERMEVNGCAFPDCTAALIVADALSALRCMHRRARRPSVSSPPISWLACNHVPATATPRPQVQYLTRNCSILPATAFASHYESSGLGLAKFDNFSCIRSQPVSPSPRLSSPRRSPLHLLFCSVPRPSPHPRARSRSLLNTLRDPPQIPPDPPFSRTACIILHYLR